MNTKWLINIFLGISVMMAGCSMPFSGDNKAATPASVDGKKLTPAEKVVISEMDILDRPYKVIGEVNASDAPKMPFSKANKLDVTNMLREEASKMGADGVIFVNYILRKGTWQSPDHIDAKGKAIKFTHY